MKTISSLREWMGSEGYSAFIAPSCDPHQSEYVAARFKVRGELSGFDGSAGTVVVEDHDGALWTDSRYFLQAKSQLEGSGLKLMKQGVAGTPSIEEYLKDRLSSGDRVAIDGKLVSAMQFETMKSSLSPIEIVDVTDPFDALWSDREAMPKSKLNILETIYSGKSSQKKIEEIRNMLSFSSNNVYLVTTLDTIAWITNTRGSDVEYNPVSISYCAIEADITYIFIDRSKVTADIEATLLASGIKICEYSSFENYLASLSSKEIIYNPAKLSYLHYKILLDAGASLKADPITGGCADYLKSIKNKIEIEGFKTSMVHDGIAMVRFMMWIEELLASGGETSEIGVSDKLRELRSQSPLFKGESFGSIVGFRSNGAIVHYSATEQSDRKVSGDGFLLIDSGGQYLTGTTDITRTLYFGTPSERERHDYSLVLKGNINLARCKFPEGTRGSQLDILARKALIGEGLNYHHGTGHGVGHYLCVHEGPQSIRKEENPVTLAPGMVLTDEPGLYRTGEYGIRLENMMVCREHSKTEFDNIYEFEILTLTPFEIKCIDIEILLPYQRKWLNAYHLAVYDKLSPHLNSEECEWLAKKTKAI